jgi:DNA primase
VAVEPDGLDPCDLRQQKGDLALRDLIAKRVPLFEFAIRTEIKLHKLDSAEGRVNALNATAPLVAQIRDKSLRPEYSRLLAGWLGIEVELVTAAVNQGLKKQPQNSSVTTVEEPITNVQWRPNPQEPRLILEREVLKARLQMPSLIINWAEIEANAFTHPAYSQLSAVIAAHPEQSSIEIEHIADENMRSLFTELNVEPIRADGEVTGHYVESIVARLREVAISRAIAELKSSLQRLNPVENEQEYNAAFAGLVALETTRRGLHDLALRSI